MVVGVIGTIASAVMACKATTKVGDILEESKKTIDTIHEFKENPEKAEKYEYTEEDSKKDLAITYCQTGVKLAKLYGPSVVLGALSLTSMVASNRILKKRNAALGAAYAALDKSYKLYRGRVAERFGEEVEKEIRYNIKAKEIEEKIVDEKGKEKMVKKTVNMVDGLAYSPYARFFDASSREWEDDSEYNLMFLRAEQDYATDRLRAKGFLSLNEVYERLDIPTTKEGQIVGWVYNPDDPVGDNYVDFGIYQINREENHRFVNGYEPTILLDFNIDGNLLDLLK